ncbi:MAG: hypothetical protein ACHQQ3_01465 [Gemmatimonadales bacterium]
MWSRRLMFVAALALVARPGIAQQKVPFIDMVADVALDVIAVAESDSAHPVIRYNPVLLQRVGPELATFVLVHESAHIRLGHRHEAGPEGDDSSEPSDSTATQEKLRAMELAADCLTAHMIAAKSPSLLARIISWFEAAGDERPDAWHPSGAERAKRLSVCSTNSTQQLA